MNEQAWDVGAAGIVPNIVGGPQGIETIGISNDESATNAVVAVEGAPWPPTSLDGTIAFTANSTGEYAVEQCLAAAGLDITTANFHYGSPSEVKSMLDMGNASYGGLWAPHVYTWMEANPGADLVCSGAEVGAIVPGGIMVRKEFGEQSSDLVAKILAAWMRGISYIKDPANRAQVLAYMDEYYASYNVTISDGSMQSEIDLRPLFTTDEQLAIMARENGAPSQVDGWYQTVTNFMATAGMIAQAPNPSSYITDKYMMMVKNDPMLYSFANGEDVDMPTPSTPADGNTTAPAAPDDGTTDAPMSSEAPAVTEAPAAGASTSSAVAATAIAGPFVGLFLVAFNLLW